MQDQDERSLITRCINGEKSAWDSFVERFSGLIYWAIREGLKRKNYPYSQEDLRDIFQNVFVLLWEKRKLEQIQNREKISCWLTMVAANCALNYSRNKQVPILNNENLKLDEIPANDCGVAEALDQEKLNESLVKMLNLLLPRERIIIKLCYLYDKTHQEIAEILKIPTNTVSSLIKRTKEKLKEELTKQGWKNF